MKLWGRIAGLLAVLLVIAGCQGAVVVPAPNPTAEPLTFGLSISSLSTPFVISIQEGALEAAKRLGVEVIVQNAQSNAARQAGQLEQLIARKVDALIINPVDGAALAAVVLTANRAGIPVFTIDQAIGGGEVVTHIASDNISGGQMAAEYLVDLIDEQGAVVELQGVPGASATQERGQGFDATLADYPAVEIVAQAAADFDRWRSKKVFAQILAQRSQVDAVFAHNDQMILGAIEAAREAGRADNIVFIGFDGIGDAVLAMEQGELTATIVQQPAEMGRLGVELATDYLVSGTNLPDFTPVDLALVAQ